MKEGEEEKERKSVVGRCNTVRSLFPVMVWSVPCHAYSDNTIQIVASVPLGRNLNPKR